MFILFFLTCCIYISFTQTFELDHLENFRDLKKGISIEATNEDESLVTLDIVSVSRKPFRVSGLSSISIPTGVVPGTLSDLAEVEYDDVWEQSYSIEFNSPSNCYSESEDDTIFLILNDEIGNTKFQTVNFTINPTCSQSIASLPLSSTIQTYSDSVFTTPSDGFNLGDTVYCRTEFATAGSISAAQITSATLTASDSVFDLTTPGFQLREYESASINLISFKLSGTQLGGVSDGAIISLAVSFSLSYSGNFRRSLGSTGLIESRAIKNFQIYLSEKCDTIGKLITKKCEGGEILKICQSDGFHILKDTCGIQAIIDTEDSSRIYVAICFIFMIASVAIGINLIGNTKKKD